MTRYERAAEYHHKGFNCCQAVLASFHDVTGLPNRPALTWAAALGPGPRRVSCAGPSRGCDDAGMLTPVDAEDPVGSKRRTGALAKEFQRRFKEKFGDLRCQTLLKSKVEATEATPAAADLGLTNRCDVLIVTAVEILEEMRQEGK